MTDTLEIFGTEYTGVTGIIATNDQSTDLTYIRPQGTKSITQNGTGIDVASFASVDVNVSGGQPTLQSKTYNVSSAGTATVTADSGYDGLSSVAVSVPSASPYIGDATAYFTLSGQRKWRHNFEVAVEVPEGDVAGWLPDGYSQNREYSCNAVPSNTTITPTESSQTIGGANYMMEGVVTVNAIPSNYVGSGITRRSSTDLTASGATVTVPSGYYSAQASKAVASGTAGTPTATKGTVSNHSISVTPSVTNTTGYITGSTKTGTAVTVSASELVSGSQTVTSNQTVDVTNLAELVVNVPSKNTQVVQGTTRTNASTLTAIGAELTVSKTGTYDIYYSCFRTNTSSSYTWATRLYINGTAYGTAENATWTNNQQNTHLSNISLTVGDKLRVYGRNTRGTSYYVCAPTLAIVEA